MKSPASLPPSRPPKRIKLESSSPSPSPGAHRATDHDGLKLVEGDHCSICLQPLVDRTVIPTCAHEFCFECILVWTEQSRRCPLCSQRITEYLIHHIRSKFDYQKQYLAPLRTSPAPLQARARNNARREGGGGRRNGERRERVWGRGARRGVDRDEADELGRAVARRRWVYDHGLYAKHVASNSFTRYRPNPTPVQFSSSPDLITRMTIFLRRELMVWPNLDVEFLTTFTISLMKSIDIRSEAAVNLLAEFLDMDAVSGVNAPAQIGGDRGLRKNAEHFAHEVYCYLRSPYRDLSVYDSVVQYDTPADTPPPLELEQSWRWRVVPPRARSMPSSSSSPKDGSRSRTRSRSREPRREGHRHRHRHAPSPPRRRRRHSVESSRSRSPPPRQRQRGTDRNHKDRRHGVSGGRNDSRAESPPLPPPLPPPRRSRSRSMDGKRNRSPDRDRDERHDRGGAHGRRKIDEQTHGKMRGTESGKDHILVGPTSPSLPSSAEAGLSKVAVQGHLATTAEEVEQQVDVGAEIAVVEKGEGGSRSGSRSPLRTRLAQTQTPAPPGIRGPLGERDDDPQLQPQPATQPAAMDRRKLRPDRNQGIFQAIQAHLGSHSARGREGRPKRPVAVAPEVQREAVADKGKDQHVDTSDRERHLEAKHSLLPRLSDPQSTSSLAVVTKASNTDSTDPKPKLTGPEIMARTRARLAKLKNEPVAGVLPASADLFQNGQDRVDRSTPQPSHNDMRTRLFRRLEEEKRHIPAPEHLPPSAASLSTPDANQSSSTQSDPHAAEVKLRMQAQLRVRLAAAKREPSGGSEVGRNGIEDAVNADFGRKEESLRTKLRERRT